MIKKCDDMFASSFKIIYSYKLDQLNNTKLQLKFLCEQRRTLLCGNQWLKH